MKTLVYESQVAMEAQLPPKPTPPLISVVFRKEVRRSEKNISSQDCNSALTAITRDVDSVDQATTRQTGSHP